MAGWLRRGAFGAAAVTALLAVATALATAVAATPSQIVAKLNLERVQNGIPGGIRLDGAETRACEHHIRYEELNGIGWTHTETPGKPGYTTDGMRAGILGDQADTGSWASGDPYFDLPLHLATLMNPRLARVGAFERGSRTCVDLGAGYTRTFAKDEIFAYPGDGRRGVPAAQTVHGELPFAPGDLVGLAQGRTTGPYIYVFAEGPWVTLKGPKLASLQLRGPGGRVALRLVDPLRQRPLAPYVPLGVSFAIPVSPLAPHTTYTATAKLVASTDTVTKRWRFTTG